MYKVVILTISDRCSRQECQDVTGKTISDIIKTLPAEIIKYDLIPDDMGLIKINLINYCDILKPDLVLTNGGTGFSLRDVTPEATKEVITKEIPGISEVMRLEGAKQTRLAYLSRGVSGIRNNTLIVNLPGSPKAAEESLNAILDILPHGIDILKGAGH